MSEAHRNQLTPGSETSWLRFVSACSARSNAGNRAAVSELARTVLEYLDDGSLLSRYPEEILADLGSPDFPRLVAARLSITPGTARDRMRDISDRYERLVKRELSRAEALLILVLEYSMAPALHAYARDSKSQPAPLRAELSGISHVLGKWATEHTQLRTAAASVYSRDEAGAVTAPLPAISTLFTEVFSPRGVPDASHIRLASAATAGLADVAVRRNALLGVSAYVMSQAAELGLIGSLQEELGSILPSGLEAQDYSPPPELLVEFIRSLDASSRSNESWFEVFAQATG